MRVLGLMSGTSLDGLDIISVILNQTDRLEFEIERFKTIPYTAEWKEKLASAHLLDAENLIKLSHEYGRLLAKMIIEQCVQWKLTPDLISSHGQTIFHNPTAGFTLQIGNVPELFTKTGIPVVCDFRPQDVAFGGQGAPLVPAIDRMLFGEFDGCLNLGGFSNISLERNHTRVAWDISPVNFVMNQLVAPLGLEYDDNGSLARMGKINPDLLEQLEAIDYYHLPAPKSLGREWVESEFMPLLSASNTSTEDALRTVVEHVSMRIAHDCATLNRILVTGGGAWNTFLMDRIRHHHRGEWIIPDSTLVNGKEALAFATLGYLRWHGMPNVLASVTGASKDHSSGVIFGK